MANTVTRKGYQVEITFFDVNENMNTTFYAKSSYEAQLALSSAFGIPWTEIDVDPEDAEWGIWLAPLPIEAAQELEHVGDMLRTGLGRIYDTDVEFRIYAEWSI